MIPAREVHQDEALKRLTDSFKGRSTIEGILKSLSTELQSAEDAELAVIASRILPNATNAQLDILGAQVGENRDGRGDERYRAAILLRIHINRSSGTVDDVLQIGALVGASEIQYEESYPARFTLRLYDIDGAVEVGRALKDTRPAGVLASLEYTTGAPSSYMRFGSTTTGAVGSGGFGSTHDGTAGKIVGGAFST